MPKKLLKKVNAAITVTYEMDSFNLNELSNTTIPKKDYLFKIFKTDVLIGYAYIGEAN